MFDAHLRPLIDPPLNRVGQWIAATGVTANQVTLLGMAIGLVAAAAIGVQHYAIGLGLIALSRVLDGLDGAIARATAKSDFGG
ncbi:MAG: hypothetical protein C0476_06945, partial [Sphingomonas sp.]|nr:hypothetical protein [Sphingomonas sp.]